MARSYSKIKDKVKVIAIGNPKGGVGKTATTISIARIMKDNPVFHGKKLLLIDTDPLGILSKMIVSDKRNIEDKQTLLPVLQKGKPLSSVIQKNAWPDITTGVEIDYICSHRPIGKLESIERFDLYKLASFLDEVKDDYFKIMIDCPANSNNLYFSSCIASDLIIFPFGSIESLSGLEVTCLELCSIDEQLIDNVKILFAMQNVDSELTASLINTARQYLDFPQFETIIRRCERFSLEIAESQTTGIYSVPDSIAVNDYLFFVDELFSHDFKKEFKNKQRFSFGQSRIDERLWSAFYETSFLITNEREKAREKHHKSAMQEVHMLERELKKTGSVATPAKKKKSKKILTETCLQTCSSKQKILGKTSFFYIAELLPGIYRHLQKEGLNRYAHLFHPDCFELAFSRLFFQQERFASNSYSLDELMAFEITDRERALNRTLRKKMQNSFLTLIRDPKMPEDISYLLHFWDILRDREYLTRWNILPGKHESSLFGSMSSYLEKGLTIVIMGVSDDDLTLTRKNLGNNANYQNFQTFKGYLEEKLKLLST